MGDPGDDPVDTAGRVDDLLASVSKVFSQNTGKALGDVIAKDIEYGTLNTRKNAVEEKIRPVLAIQRDKTLSDDEKKLWVKLTTPYYNASNTYQDRKDRAITEDERIELENLYQTALEKLGQFGDLEARIAERRAAEQAAVEAEAAAAANEPEPEPEPEPGTGTRSWVHS
jgi:hypothetical protein